MRMPLIFNVQAFSLHDGPGIRTTVFFKGCPLRCAWCHNPESQSFEPETIFHEERCIGCGHCDDGCASGAREIVGRTYGVDELVRLVLRDRQIFETSGGGVTFSGGEVLAQDGEYVLAVARKLKRVGVNLAVDTSGMAEWGKIEPLLPYVDEWLYDLKAISPEIHEKYVKADNRLILENLKRLSAAGARINLRVPVIPGVNADDGETKLMAEFARANAVCYRVNLLPYHKLGQDKLSEPAYFEVPDAQLMQHIRSIWLDAGFCDVLIGG